MKQEIQIELLLRNQRIDHFGKIAKRKMDAIGNIYNISNAVTSVK